MRKILPGCCAEATAPITKSTKTITEKPNHFRFWIVDFRLWDESFEENTFINLFGCLSIRNLKSKIQNCFT